MGLRDTRVYAVDMPKGSKCDCGAAAETQFCISTTAKEAKQTAKLAAASRKLGNQAHDVCCGLCMTKKISLKGLIVAEILQFSPIKLDRLPFITKCLDCGQDLGFGVYAYYQAESALAICKECGAKRGWEEKDRAMHGVKLAEAKEDLKALRRQIKDFTATLYMLQESVDLHKVAELYVEVEKQIIGALGKVSNYLMNGIATTEEQKILADLSAEIKQLQALALQIKKELDTRLYLIERAERKRKLVEKALEEDDEDQLEEEQRHAEMANAEVST